MTFRALIVVLTAGLTLAACDTFQTTEDYPTKSVHVLSRTWEVVQVSDGPVTYRATRDWNNLNPFGPPARTRTAQAMAAIREATGCTPLRSTMYQNISGQFYSQVRCN